MVGLAAEPPQGVAPPPAGRTPHHQVLQRAIDRLRAARRHQQLRQGVEPEMAARGLDGWSAHASHRVASWHCHAGYHSVWFWREHRALRMARA
jgi:hypothetical protein